MMRASLIILLLFICALDSHSQYLQPADCPEPTAIAIMEFNSVRARIENGGLMWQNRNTSQAQYEVPSGQGVSAIYAGSIWAGGVTADGQLKLAANKFGSSGQDYAAGPLVPQTALTNAETCSVYDEIYATLRSDVSNHLAYHNALLEGTVDTEFPEGYTTPEYFSSWPAHGNEAMGQDFYLAPFIDFDGNGEYDPAMGDAPGYTTHRVSMRC